MYTYLLFDLDGTLTDPKEGITRCVQYALHQLGIEEPDPNRLLAFIGPPLHISFEEYYGFSKEKAAQAVELYRSRFRTKGILENTVLDGAPEMLRDLKAGGYVLALATSKLESFARQILEQFHLDAYFDCITGSEPDNSRSRKAEVIRETARRLAVTDKTQMLMIGDRHHDIDGAKEYGIASMGVRCGYAEPGELERAGADYIVNTIEELHHWLINGGYHGYIDD